MKTKVFSSEKVEKVDPKTGEVVKDSNGKPVMVRKQLEVETVTDFANHVRYMSNVRIIARPVKLWAQDPKMQEPTYGVTFKIFKVEVEPSASSSTSLANYLNDAFLDSGDEEEDASAHSNLNGASQSESEESEEDSDDSEEEEDPPPPVVKKGKRKAKASA